MPQPAQTAGPLAGDSGDDGAGTGCTLTPQAGQNFAMLGIGVRHRVHGSSTPR
jgi:hypothetical protein